MIKVFKNDKGKEQVLKSYNQLLKLWNIDIEEVDLETKYGITHCIIAGNKNNPPLLMLHGVGDNSAVMWVLNIKGLADYFYCIAVDTIGGPGKSIPNENYKKKSFSQVDWINEVTEMLKIKDFSVIGVSNGGYMAFNYTTKESKRINRVVCLEGGMVINPLKTMFKTILALFPEILIPNRNNMTKIMKKMISPDSDFFQRCPEVVDHMIMVMKNHNQKAMFLHKLEKYDKIKAISVREKIYFLIGGYRITAKKDFTDILDDGGFKYKVINGAGHGINHEQPEIINNEIINFLLG
jgi:pimeloyl-ACP methyl ester carboxylesterase